MDADLVISRTAATQHSVVGRRQLLDAGVPGHVIEHRLSKGLLVPVHAGVYRVASGRTTWHQRIMAATLAAGPGAVASHRAAAFLHGLAGIDPRAEVTVTRGRAPRPPGVVVHRPLSLSSADVEERDGIPRTRVPATLVGLSAVVPVPLLEAALDDALVRGLVSCPHLLRRLDAVGQKGRRGAATIAGLLAARSTGPRWAQSEFERRLLALVVAAALPRPVLQFEVVLPNGRRAYLDFAWPDLLVGVEADSYRHHASRRDWAKDHTRNNLLTSLGWRVLPVTWEDMVERPDQVIALLRRARAA